MKKARLAALFSLLLLGRYFDDLAPSVLKASAQTAQEMGALSKDAPVEQEIAGGQVHQYRLALISDQFLRVIVEEKGVDVVVAVSSPEDQLLIEMSHKRYGSGRPERVCFIAQTSGDYRLRIRPLRPDAKPGRYTVKVEEWRNATDEDRKQAEADKALAEAYSVSAMNPEALRKASEKYNYALALWRQTGDRRGEADTLDSFCRAQFSLGQQAQALNCLQQLLPLSRVLADQRSEADALIGLASIYWATGDAQKGLDHLGLTLPLMRAVGNRLGETMVLNNFGVFHSTLGETQTALDYYLRALPMAREIGDRRMEAQLLNNIGMLYSRLGDDQTSLAYFDQALAANRAIGNRGGEGQSLSDLGLTHLRLQDPRKAIDLIGQALPLQRASSDLPGEAVSLAKLGVSYFRLNDFPKALEAINQAIEIQRKIGDRRGEALSMVYLGELQSKSGEPAKALDSFEQALKLARTTGFLAVEAEGLFKRAEAERDRGNLAAALEKVEECVAVIESLRSKAAGQQMRTSFLASNRKYYEFRIELLMQMHRREPAAEYDARALLAAEQMRARSLIEILADARAEIRQGAPADLLARETQLQRQINAKEQLRLRLRTRGGDNEARAAAIEKEISELLTSYAELQSQIRQTSPRYASLTQPRILSAPEIRQQLLDDDAMLLEYALGDERSYLWALTKSGLKSFELSKREEIETAARRVYELATARNRRLNGETPQQRLKRVAKADADYAQAAQALSRMALGPVVAELRRMQKKRLLVVSDGALQYVPFSALPKPESGRAGERERGRENNPQSFEPLVAHYEIVSLPSASTLAALRLDDGNRGASEKLLAVLADPVFETDDPRVGAQAAIRAREQTSHPSGAVPLAAAVERSARDAGVSRFLRLKFTRAEAEAIASLAPADRKLTALDFNASRAALDRADLSRYRFVHFATHGLLNSQHPELSGIVLSLINEQGQPQDGFLRLHEIYNLKLNADLVVLSGCQTALGKEIKGEGLVGLTRGFMHAGARSVMASLWSVDDKATAELMRRLYAGMLKEGLPAPAALRAAQNEMRKQKHFASPYYWSAFTLQGEWK